MINCQLRREKVIKGLQKKEQRPKQETQGTEERKNSKNN